MSRIKLYYDPTEITNNLFTSLGAGTYTLSIKDANGCIKDTAVSISESPPLNFPNVNFKRS